MIGNRWSSKAAKTAMAVATQGVPPTPVVDLTPEPVLEIRTEQLIAQPTNFAIPGVGVVPSVMAQLPGPPQGQAYRIERYTITNSPPAATTVLVYAGDPADNFIVDAIDYPLSTMLTADDPNGIWLAASTPFSVVWPAITSAGYGVNVQYAVIEV